MKVDARVSACFCKIQSRRGWTCRLGVPTDSSFPEMDSISSPFVEVHSWKSIRGSPFVVCVAMQVPRTICNYVFTEVHWMQLRCMRHVRTWER